MGKKTNEAMASIASIEQKCAVFVAQISPLTTEINKCIETMQTFVDVMDERTEFHMPSGSQSLEGEQAVEADPKYQKAAKGHDIVAAKFKEVLLKKQNAQSSLRKELTGLKKAVTDFEKMVEAKKKKWFVSKNSVPAAEVFIATANKYLRDCAHLLQN